MKVKRTKVKNKEHKMGYQPPTGPNKGLKCTVGKVKGIILCDLSAMYLVRFDDGTEKYFFKKDKDVKIVKPIKRKK